MKKLTATILSLFGLAAFSAPVAFANGLQTKALTASADGLTELTFAAPTDVAATANHTAVADGNVLYLFNRTNGGFWQEYTHAQAISQIAFNETGVLYFRDEYRNLYSLNVDELTENSVATDTAIDCGAFFFKGDALYYANAADSNTLLYDGGGESSPMLFNGAYKEFFFQNDTLYALSDGNGLFTLHLSSSQATVLTNFSTARSQLAYSDNKIFTADSSGLYCYDLNEGGETLLDQGTYTALCTNANGIYALKGTEVYAYSTATNTLQKAADEFTKPHVSHIPTHNLLAFTQGEGSFSLVKTNPSALLVEVRLEGATQTFPLVKTTRTESITALKIGETESYALLSYRTDVTKPYQNFVVAKNGYQALPSSPAYDSPKTGYITSGLSLYKFPHLDLPTVAELPRGAQVTVLSEVNGLDCDYYEIRYGEQVGYLPKVYVAHFDGSKKDPTETTVGEKETGKEGIWRMVYILLGATAIGVLVDFLILRKKNND